MLYGIVALAGLLCVCGSALVWFIIQNSQKDTLNKIQEKQLLELADKYQKLDAENSQISTENTMLKANYENHRKYMEEKLLYIEQSKADMENKFKSISNEILRNQAQFISDNQSKNLATLLNPFKEQLVSFKDEVCKANTENVKNKSSFDEQFKNLISLNQALSENAQNLTDALRGSKKMQGDWGEIELNRILEVAGLQKNIDYYTQENFKNENNQNFRPDVVVRLPNNRCVVVDSKVSMNDYITFVNAENSTDKELALQKHIQCIKNHIDELSNKEYQKLMKETSLDYVVIFIPIESAFVEAIKKENTLYDYAYKKNVALTTPSSLLPILRTIENLWQIENQNKNVQKIAEIGGSLYDKLANFVEDMHKIDKSLLGARQSYDNAILKLSNGRGNALSLATRLKEYGAKATKAIGIEFDDTGTENLKIENNSEEKVS